MNFVLSFISQIVKLISTQKGDPVRDEVVKDAYKWLLKTADDSNDKSVEIDNNPFLTPGKIYIFAYEPKYASKYDYYDKHPIVLSLGKIRGKDGILNLGLNISWYPPKARKYIVEKIREFYEGTYKAEMRKYPNKAIDQKSVELDLYALKVALDRYGLSFALRSYYPDRTKTPKLCVSYEHWDKTIKLDQPRIFPEIYGTVSLFDVYKSYETYVKYNLNNKMMIDKKRDENKKLNKYKFIK